MPRVIQYIHNPENDAFKDRLRRLRKEKGWSTENLALLVQKSASTVRSWESGKVNPDVETLVLLATLLDCSTDYLLCLARHRSRENFNIANHVVCRSPSMYAQVR